jgi:hypothetical protein
MPASAGFLQERSISTGSRACLPGLHVVGAPWLTHRVSGNLYGMVADAEQVADALSYVAAEAA